MSYVVAYVAEEWHSADASGVSPRRCPSRGGQALGLADEVWSVGSFVWPKFSSEGAAGESNVCLQCRFFKIFGMVSSL